MSGMRKYCQLLNLFFFEPLAAPWWCFCDLTGCSHAPVRSKILNHCVQLNLLRDAVAKSFFLFCFWVSPKLLTLLISDLYHWCSKAYKTCGCWTSAFSHIFSCVSFKHIFHIPITFLTFHVASSWRPQVYVARSHFGESDERTVKQIWSCEKIRETDKRLKSAEQSW